MPKRWLIVSGASYTWQFVDEDDRTGHRVTLAQSNETWESPEEVEAAIREIQENQDFARHDGTAAG